MRDYSKVGSGFWTGKTGKALRGQQELQLVALYLMTSPHANMIGVYQCPILYIAHETGIPIEGATKALRSLEDGGFCTYDDETETVWVCEMAKFQIGDALEATDKRVISIRKQVAELPEGRIRSGFEERYGGAFHLRPGGVSGKPHRSPIEAPPKPETETETETGEGKPFPASPKAMRGTSGKSPAAPDGFERFWACWPKGRKVGKADAIKAWAKLKPDAELLAMILAAVERWKTSVEWRKDGGQFIPHPATWLTGRRWEDELVDGGEGYTESELAVMTAYNATLAASDWPEAIAAPFSPERAAAIRTFLTFGRKPDWLAGYFGWLRDHLQPKPGFGFDWAIRRDSFLRACEGNFAALQEAA